MKHDHHIVGSTFRLRPVQLDDSAFIVDLRSDPDLTQYLHPISGKISDQEKWLNTYFERPDDYYFVVERLDNQKPEGLISLYEVDNEKHEAEWGRWILKKESTAAVESAFLIYEFAFGILNLDQVYCRTVANNKKVCSFHDSCGLETKRVLKNYFLDQHDAIEQIMTQENWLKQKSLLGRIIERRAA